MSTSKGTMDEMSRTGYAWSGVESNGKHNKQAKKWKTGCAKITVNQKHRDSICERIRARWQKRLRVTQYEPEDFADTTIATKPIVFLGRERKPSMITESSSRWEWISSRFFFFRFRNEVLLFLYTKRKPETSGPVSYTHLDVYKRQIVSNCQICQLLPCKPLANLPRTFIECNLPVGHVSTNHWCHRQWANQCPANKTIAPINKLSKWALLHPSISCKVRAM